MGTFTPNFNLYKPAIGETGWGAAVDTNWDTIDANLVNLLPRSYLAGLQLTPNTGTPTFKVNIGAGQAQDAGNAGAMTLAATLIKDISATWAVGSGNGGLAPSLVLGASTWYHVFLIKRTDTNVVDGYFDTSVTAANIPAPYTLFRRLGSVKTDPVTKPLLQWVQDGDYVRWLNSVMDVSTNNPGTNAVTATLASVPTGLPVFALFNAVINVAATTNAAGYFSDLAVTDEAPSITAAPGVAETTVAAGAQYGAAYLSIRTNTSGQIRYRLTASDGNTNVRLVTLGWTDTRGRNA